MRTKLVFLVMMFLTGVMSHALEFEVDGVLYSTNEDDENTVTASHTTFADYRNLLVVPADVTFDGTSYKVTRVGDGDGAWLARHIVLSEGIEKIEDNAFTKVNGVRTIDVPCSVVKLGEWAFHGEYIDCECEDAFVPQEIYFRSADGLLNCGGQSAIELFGVLCGETKIYIPKGQKQLLPASFVDEIRNLIEMDFDYAYVPLVREGVQWVHFWSRPWALDPTDRLATPYVYEFSGTEEIGGEEYAKLYGYLEGGSIDETEEPMAYVRERDKVVYRRWDKVGPDEIIYDFNNMANAVPEESRGEWYENGNYTYVVEDIVVDGRLRKMHNFDGCVVIEGVGALNNNASIMDGLFPAIPSDGSSNGLSHVVEHGDIVVEGERRADYLAWGSGDANGDGLVNGADVTALYAYLLCTPDDDEYPFATIGMDLNRDGYLSGADVTALYNLLLN